MSKKKKTTRKRQKRNKIIKSKIEYDGSKPLKSMLQEMVSDKILGGMVASQAYFDTYDSCKSLKIATAASSRLLANVSFQKRLEYKRAKLAEKEEIKQREVLREAARISFSDIAEVLDESGNIRDIKSIPIATRRAIASIEVMEEFQGKGKDREFIGYVKKLKFWDKNKGIEKLFKHLGMFAKDNDQRMPVAPMIVTFIEAEKKETKQIESIVNDSG